jgi:site-specific DNA-methyltransferase (adenine-specific)
MATSEAYNVDCMDYMNGLPDNAFDLAVVDTPYGGACSQSVHVERERENKTGRITGSGTAGVYLKDTSVSRTGGTWATKYGKKSSRGT